MLIGLGVLVSACDWTSFDTLANQTWVKSTQTPSIGSTAYGVAIVPGAAPQPSGGTLGVISNLAPTYSTIVYDDKGGSTAGNVDRLNDHMINTLTTPPIVVSDGLGDLAIVAPSTATNAVTIHSGSAGSLADVMFISTAPPDAATYAGSAVVATAGTNIATLAAGSSAPVVCPAQSGGVPIEFAALTGDANTLYGWTKGGNLVSAPVTSLLVATCMVTPPAFTQIMSTSVMPVDGASLFLIGTGVNQSLVAVGSTADGTSGEVAVVALASPSTMLSTPAVGVQAAALGELGSTGTTYLALGFPATTVDGVTSAGTVELHQIIPATGTLSAASDETLFCDEPTTGQVFGRSIAILPYNGTNVLSVAANNEVFTYFRTLLYSDTRQ
jgi:hypothetical protein